MLTKLYNYLTTQKIRRIIATYLILVVSIILVSITLNLKNYSKLLQFNLYDSSLFDYYFIQKVLPVVFVAPIIEELYFRFWLVKGGRFNWLKVFFFFSFIYLVILDIGSVLGLGFPKYIFNLEFNLPAGIDGKVYVSIFTRYNYFVVSLIVLPFIYWFRSVLVKRYEMMMDYIVNKNLLSTMVVLISIVFGLSHYNNFIGVYNPVMIMSSFVQVILGGMFLSLLRFKFGILTSILFHMIWNSSLIIMKNSVSDAFSNLSSLLYLIPYYLIIIFFFFKSVK
jgi:Type II CAAX prenyl endopeptidase Rce1-like